MQVANLKIADNASLTTYAACVILSVFDLIIPRPIPGQVPSTSVLKSLSRLLREYNFLLEKYGQGADENHLLFIHGLVKACTYDDKPYRYFVSCSISNSFDFFFIVFIEFVNLPSVLL